ncbi:hypothetical protein T484DRAFT_1845488 [Baffinella frigidus]|nr:hypothetical protein T484DRAFT_1845488 [Cryptophyta sp. CCMP2293]
MVIRSRDGIRVAATDAGTALARKEADAEHEKLVLQLLEARGKLETERGKRREAEARAHAAQTANPAQSPRLLLRALAKHLRSPARLAALSSPLRHLAHASSALTPLAKHRASPRVPRDTDTRPALPDPPSPLRSMRLRLDTSAPVEPDDGAEDPWEQHCSSSRTHPPAGSSSRAAPAASPSPSPEPAIAHAPLLASQQHQQGRDQAQGVRAHAARLGQRLSAMAASARPSPLALANFVTRRGASVSPPAPAPPSSNATGHLSAPFSSRGALLLRILIGGVDSSPASAVTTIVQPGEWRDASRRRTLHAHAAGS